MQAPILAPSFFEENNKKNLLDINDVRILTLLGDSVTTDHISPVGV